MQHAAKLAARRHGFVERRALDPHIALRRAHRQQPRRAPRDIGQVEVLDRDREVRPLDRRQILQIIDQPQQMPPRAGDICSIGDVIVAQRPVGLRGHAVGIGDDPAQRIAQRSPDPAAEAVGQIGCDFCFLGGQVVGRQVARRTVEPGKLAIGIDARHRRQPDAVRRAADRRLLPVEPCLRRQRAQDRKAAIAIVVQREQPRDRLAQHALRIETEPRRRRVRHMDQVQRGVGRPQPVGIGPQEIRLPPMRRFRLPRRAGLPAAHLQPDAQLVRLGAHGQRDIVLTVRGDDRAGQRDTQPLDQPHQRGDLRHRHRPPDRAAGAPVQLGKTRLGIEQQPVRRQPPDGGRRGWPMVVHAAVPSASIAA